MVTAPEELRRAYAENGYVVVPRLFGAEEMRALKAEMQRILAAVCGSGQAAGSTAEAIGRSGVFVGLAAHSALFREAVADARLRRLLTIALGPEVEFLSDKVVFKSEATDFGTPWHQDWPYWQGSHKVSLWIPADDATPENGCLRVIPGSHRAPARHDGEATDGHGFANRVRHEQIDEEAAMTVALPAGGVVLFHDLLLHASHPNTAGTDRFVWIPTYREAHAVDPNYPWAVARRVLPRG